MGAELALCVVQIGEAREDLHQLLRQTRRDAEEVDFLDLLNRVLRLLEPIARDHPCVIALATTGVQQATVRAVRYDLQRALQCLVDNAIKYSYVGTHSDGSPFEVRVSTELVQDDRYVEALISNYGVGFPMDRLPEFQTVGGRGRVRDPRATRSGSGLGLAYAYDVFEAAGGYIHIESSPRRKRPRGTGEPAWLQNGCESGAALGAQEVGIGKRNERAAAAWQGAGY